MPYIFRPVTKILVTFLGMHKCKFQVLTNRIAWHIDNGIPLVNFLPACRFSSRGRIAADSSPELKWILFSRRTDIDKLQGFKNKMGNCVNLGMKYDYLKILMKDNINLYYRYLCDNTAEVLTIMYAADSVRDDFCDMSLVSIKTPNIQRLMHITRSLGFDRTANDIRQYMDAEKKRNFRTDIGFALKVKETTQKKKGKKDKETDREMKKKTDQLFEMKEADRVRVRVRNDKEMDRMWERKKEKEVALERDGKTDKDINWVSEVKKETGRVKERIKEKETDQVKEIIKEMVTIGETNVETNKKPLLLNMKMIKRAKFKAPLIKYVLYLKKLKHKATSSDAN
ncbi:uncharacterized protein LOC115483463 isoform X2 [Drosophila hydei]|uniref:Uncharacterized protein LOC111593727 isoform X2 n=1 Tax=Drosophila hydei TaxID=7224 RepID=A0A6J1LDJ8_DROHY|nr:uncharacterized protein LOC111593727 isoform X2 [Drosophila hydei]XP_030081406.1 uncharacterized protein LOC115483463 isoform X2 [Drosophila hydei]